MSLKLDHQAGHRCIKAVDCCSKIMQRQGVRDGMSLKNKIKSQCDGVSC